MLTAWRNYGLCRIDTMLQGVIVCVFEGQNWKMFGPFDAAISLYRLHELVSSQYVVGSTDSSPFLYHLPHPPRQRLASLQEGRLQLVTALASHEHTAYEHRGALPWAA